jgi:tRNASer (uridine44-2'-O)-methyltransferase
LTINACCAQIVSDARTAADQRPFVARSAEIAITNCTRIPDDVKASLVAKIVSYLLLDEAVSMEWRRGRAATIAQLAASALSDGDKLHLKSQGNGIATFVRNHAHVFTLERNKVTLRDYRHRPMTATAPARMCWFNAHHPDGCPLAAKCTLQHL